MDKEMKLKVEEILKNCGTRELNLDDMAKVAGGGSSCRTVPPDFTLWGLTEEQAGGILQSIVDACGIDVAAAYAQEVWAKSADWLGYMKASKDRNPGYYAVGMVWEKGYNQSRGGNGY